jgi:hypothetical protein
MKWQEDRVLQRLRNVTPASCELKASMMEKPSCFKKKKKQAPNKTRKSKS